MLCVLMKWVCSNRDVGTGFGGPSSPILMINKGSLHLSMVATEMKILDNRRQLACICGFRPTLRREA